MVSSLLRNFFKHQFLVDDREPSIIFQVPLLFGGSKWGLRTPSLFFWVQVGVCFAIMISCLIILAISVYYIIVLPRKRQEKIQQQRQQQQQQQTFAYIFGYGIAIPLAILIPFEIIQYLKLESLMLTTTMCSLPTYASLRCLEAMYGYTPKGADSSLFNFVLYFAFVCEVLFDSQTNQPQSCARHDIRKNLQVCMVMLFISSGLVSMIRQYQYEPFPTETPSNTMNHNLSELFQFSHLGNNFVAALLLYSILNFGCKLFDLCMNLILGYRTNDFMSNPFFQSTSPSDFWNRWNRTVQGLMKRGVYKPIRNASNSRDLALVSTFLFSGLLHEYVNRLLFFQHYESGHDDNLQNINAATTDKPFQSTTLPIVGKAMAFFAWNGCLIIIEKVVAERISTLWSSVLKSVQPTTPQTTKSSFLPTPLVSLFVVLLTLPVSHWFTGDWVHNGFFEHVSVGLPILVKMDE